MEKYIFEHYYLVYATPTFLIGLICVMYGAYHGKPLGEAYEQYWQHKIASISKNATTSLKGTTVSYRAKRALKEFEKQANENLSKIRLYRAVTWFGFAVMAFAVIWGTMMKFNIINQL